MSGNRARRRISQIETSKNLSGVKLRLTKLDDDYFKNQRIPIGMVSEGVVMMNPLLGCGYIWDLKNKQQVLFHARTIGKAAFEICRTGTRVRFLLNASGTVACLVY
jgi:hypothetical protein